MRGIIDIMPVKFLCFTIYSCRVPGCRLYLGDRPIEITLQRMLASLSFWQKLKFGLMILHDMKPIR